MSSRLSEDEVLDAQQALAEHTEQNKPSNNLAASATQNDYEKAPGRWNAPRLNITEARRQAHARIAAENAKKI